MAQEATQEIGLNVVFRRTSKGEQEVQNREPTYRWLALAMLDGQSTVGEMIAVVKVVPDLPAELSALQKAGMIRPAEPGEGGFVLPADGDDLDFLTGEPDLVLGDDPAPPPPPPSVAKKPRASSPAPAPAAAPRAPSGGAGRWVKRFVLAAVALVVVGVAALFLAPLDGYAPTAQKLLETTVGQPVKLSSLRATVSPTPALKVDGVSIGTLNAIQIGSMVAVPTMGSWFGGGKALSSLTLRGITVKRPGLDLIAAIGLGQVPVDGLTIGRITVEDLNIDLDGLVLGPLSGHGEIGRDGRLTKVELANEDKTIRVGASADGTRLKLSVSTRRWKLPGTELSLDFLDLKGGAVPGGVEIDELDARFYEGTLTGNGTITWKGDWVAMGELKVVEGKGDILLAAISPNLSAEGRFDGTVRLASKAASVVNLHEGVKGDGSFTLRKGAIHKANLEQAVVGRGARGGDTGFDEFTGQFSFGGGAVQFNDLRLTSGVVKASGAFVADPGGQIKGRVAVEIRPKPALGVSNFTISGTSKDPVLSR